MKITCTQSNFLLHPEHQFHSSTLLTTHFCAKGIAVEHGLGEIEQGVDIPALQRSRRKSLQIIERSVLKFFSVSLDIPIDLSSRGTKDSTKKTIRLRDEYTLSTHSTRIQTKKVYGGNQPFYGASCTWWK